MAKNTSSLARFNDIFKKLAEKHGVSETLVSDIIDHFFQTLIKFITDPRMPTIKIMHFGTFRPKIGKLDWQMRSIIKHYRKGNISRERAKERLDYIYPIRRRLKQEKAGISTWQVWRKLKRDVQTEDKKQEVTRKTKTRNNKSGEN